VVQKRGRRIIGPVDLVLGAAGITILLGPNGAGKTTLLRLLHGLERLSGGEMVWQRPRSETLAAQAYVFQAPILLRRSVLENIAYPLRLRGERRATARTAAAEWAGRVGLGAALDRPSHVLSGGERQKLALARALITAPEVLFLDEPTASLDGRSTREIEAILLEAASEGVRLVMATHDLGQARRLATEVVFLYRGVVHEAAAAETFFARPATAEAAAHLNGDIVE
jgi:tungstate transport system ATP-binding protein